MSASTPSLRRSLHPPLSKYSFLAIGKFIEDREELDLNMKTNQTAIVVQRTILILFRHNCFKIETQRFLRNNLKTKTKHLIQRCTMIVVFVVDTSPSMGKPLKDTSTNNSLGSDAPTSPSPIGMSRLDLAKMTVESLVKMMERRVHDHNLKLQSDTSPFKSLHNLGFGYSPSDQFLLLSTGCQHSSQTNSAACGAGGRLLVGFGPKDHRNDPNASVADQMHSQLYTQKNEFEHQLKRLKATDWEKGEESFPDDGGGAKGLNSALSTGLQLLSRHRLQDRRTENFGQGRLPSCSILVPSIGGPGGSGATGGTQQATNALQPACLILLTDGDCLRKLPAEGGGSLQLQFGTLPLREFYREREFFPSIHHFHFKSWSSTHF